MRPWNQLSGNEQWVLERRFSDWALHAPPKYCGEIVVTEASNRREHGAGGTHSSRDSNATAHSGSNGLQPSRPCFLTTPGGCPSAASASQSVRGPRNILLESARVQHIRFEASSGTVTRQSFPEQRASSLFRFAYHRLKSCPVNESSHNHDHPQYAHCSQGQSQSTGLRDEP